MSKKERFRLRDKTAAAAFLAQFYSGIENILKRISRFYHVNLPGQSTEAMNTVRYLVI